MSEKKDDERIKLLKIVRHIRNLLADHDLVGTISLAGREGMLENHFCFNASWFKIMVVEDEVRGTTLRLMSAKTDPQEDLRDTLGALRGIAELTGVAGLSLLGASDAMDRELGATHTPLIPD